MRYKTLVTTKMEALSNNLNGLRSLYSQGVSRERFDEALLLIREKIEEIQTLINVEQEGI